MLSLVSSLYQCISVEQILEQVEEHKHGSRTRIFDIWHNRETPTTTWKEVYLWWRSTEVRELDSTMFCFVQPLTATLLGAWSTSSSPHLSSGFSNAKNDCPLLTEFLNWNSCARKFWIKILSGYPAGQGLALSSKVSQGKGLRISAELSHWCTQVTVHAGARA